jgi:protease II
MTHVNPCIAADQANVSLNHQHHPPILRYYARVGAGQQYSVHCRRAVPAGAPSLNEADVPDAASREEVVLDENRRKEEVGKAFYQVRG